MANNDIFTGRPALAGAGLLRPIAVDRPAAERPARIVALASGDRSSVERELAQRPLPIQSFAQTFAEVRKEGVGKAATFSAAFARTLSSNDQVGQFFEDVALAAPADRLAILDAQKAAGFATGVVHAVGLLPAAHGRAIMRDFLLGSGQLDAQALGACMDWLALAGKSVRERGIVIPEADAPHD